MPRCQRLLNAVHARYAYALGNLKTAMWMLKHSPSRRKCEQKVLSDTSKTLGYTVAARFFSEHDESIRNMYNSNPVLAQVGFGSSGDLSH